ncbi:MAG: AAA family ATPase [Pseudomonadota bacterium]
MIISCPKCGTKYNVDKQRFSKPNSKVRCVKCKSVFSVRIVKKSSAEASKTDTVTPSPVRKAPVDSSSCVTVTICNQKGGVSKTSTCLNLGVSLAAQGKKVLLVDFDVQANLTSLLNHHGAKSFFDVMGGHDAKIADYILSTDYGVSLLPSNSKMALLAKKHMQQGDFEYLLAEKLIEIKPKFDYIIIDTPPSGDFFTLNSLLASDLAIIPTQCEYLSLNGVEHIVRMISVINDKRGHGLKYKVLVAMYNKDITAANVILDKLKSKYAGNLLNTTINMDGAVQESHITQKPLFHYNKDSDASQRYIALANELLGLRIK